MIRGNELAIDLGLELLLALKPGQALSKTEMAAYCDAAREILGLTTKPFTKQDMFFLEDRALLKMRKAMRGRESEFGLVSAGARARHAARRRRLDSPALRMCECGLHRNHPGFCRQLDDAREGWRENEGEALGPRFVSRFDRDRDAIVRVLRHRSLLTLRQICAFTGLRSGRAEMVAQALRDEGEIEYTISENDSYCRLSAMRRMAA